VAARHEDGLPLEIVQEPNVGLSHARNAAVARVRGDFILWTDDDVRVDRQWVAAYERAIRRCPDGAVFGGVIRPRFDEDPPRWLNEALPVCEAAFAIRSVPGGDSSRIASGDGYPFGANYAIRSEEQRRHLYDPELGRQPGRLIGGEEETVIESILAAGAAGYWVPDAVVEHVIGPDRMSVEYLRAYYEGQGFVRARKSADRGKSLLSRFGELAVKELRYRFAKRREPSPVWVGALIEAAETRGVIAGRLASRSRRRPVSESAAEATCR
jgi:hypothetical protein